ncbi:DUF3369 domain-containing protein [Tissierella sp. MB52-C2]|uniref:HD domain-containing phosphohydrolase n=1 Tax=Tissierella sp. MB52-C2 TaxID=3070999 RepID=UPI00280B82FB|nr:HD domain-containing phosphohydrolase [Tissierella sp. MB52-C2]WMM24210.1 DUF3369 domain-containing protein [Tissierella sp. MB52-C2]
MDGTVKLYDKHCEKWNILIIDNDNFIHQIIKEMNKDLTFEGKSINFHSAYNTKEAIKILEKNKDIVLVLLEMFIEKEDSGLDLVKYIREDIEDEDIRILLMTEKNINGLEDNIILNYDINGYERKSELLCRKMSTVILSSIRSFKDIRVMRNNRKSMEKVVSSISNLYEKDTIGDFLISSLSHLSSLINQCRCRIQEEDELNSFVAVREGTSNIFRMIEGKGKYKDCINKTIRESVSTTDLMKINKIYNEGEHELFDNVYIAKYKSTSGSEAILLVENQIKNNYIDIDLLDIFHKSVSATFDNLCLNLEIEETQKEILYTLGEVTEARSEETSSHVKRVSKYCQVLAEEYGLSPRDIMLLTHASPIHDIGKVAIPDNVLLKPGKLTGEEFNVIKSHTTIGYNLLRNSKREILKAAAIIAHEHHERYDGKGYPRGLAGEEIHIYGRITAIADVFDALGSPRVYKKAWVMNDILNYFKEEKGKHFDPELVDILFENLNKFLEIRRRYSDEAEGEAEL